MYIPSMEFMVLAGTQNLKKAYGFKGDCNIT